MTTEASILDDTRSAALRARVGKVFPDGRLTAADTRPFTLVMDHGRRDRIYDVSGREYLDFHLSSGALTLGHAHPGVLPVIQKQVQDGGNFGAMNRAAIELAERIVDAKPSVECVKFTVSGTEANLHAIRMARAYTGRDLVLRFEGAYHGHLDMVSLSNKMTGLTPEDTGLKPDLKPIPDCLGIPDAIANTAIIGAYNDVELLEQIFADHGNNIACVIMEPIQRFIEPTSEFLNAVRDVTCRHGAILVFDEVVTGFRMGPGGAQEHYGVYPDLTVMGKIIGAGYPNGAVGGSDTVMRALFGKEAIKPVYLAGTFAGHAVAAAGGAATIDVLRGHGTYERMNALGAKAREGLRDVFVGEELPGRVYGVGPMFHISFSDCDMRNGRDTLQENKKMRAGVWNQLLHAGVHITGGRGFISAQHSDETVDLLVERFGDSVRAYLRTI